MTARNLASTPGRIRARLAHLSARTSTADIERTAADAIELLVRHTRLEFDMDVAVIE